MSDQLCPEHPDADPTLVRIHGSDHGCWVCSACGRVLERVERFDVASALDVAHRYGGIDGGHHKTWVIDQMVRALTGDRYPQWVAAQKAGDDGPNTYDWDEGIAP